jgi:hypothetical protein
MAHVKRMRKEHDSLLAIAGRLSAVIAQDAPPPSSFRLHALRLELASALMDHLQSEDWVLYPQLLVSYDIRVAEIARTFRDEMGGLAKAFRQYAEQWGSHAIEGDWKRYRLETAVILKALTDRIDRENRDLYPLFESLDKTKRPRPVASCPSASDPLRTLAKLSLLTSRPQQPR